MQNRAPEFLARIPQGDNDHRTAMKGAGNL
jgi:hypothetical protein